MTGKPPRLCRRDRPRVRGATACPAFFARTRCGLRWACRVRRANSAMLIFPNRTHPSRQGIHPFRSRVSLDRRPAPRAWSACSIGKAAPCGSMSRIGHCACSLLPPFLQRVSCAQYGKNTRCVSLLARSKDRAMQKPPRWMNPAALQAPPGSVTPGRLGNPRKFFPHNSSGLSCGGGASFGRMERGESIEGNLDIPSARSMIPRM